MVEMDHDHSFALQIQQAIQIIEHLQDIFDELEFEQAHLVMI